MYYVTHDCIIVSNLARNRHATHNNDFSTANLSKHTRGNAIWMLNSCYDSQLGRFYENGALDCNLPSIVLQYDDFQLLSRLFDLWIFNWILGGGLAATKRRWRKYCKLVCICVYTLILLKTTRSRIKEIFSMHEFSQRVLHCAVYIIDEENTASIKNIYV